MSIALPPGEHAARLIAHYLKELTRATGRRWTPQNDNDMVLLASLLDQAELPDDASDTIPPFRTAPAQVETRVTRELDYGDPAFTRWRAERIEEEKFEAARRMTRR